MVPFIAYFLGNLWKKKRNPVLCAFTLGVFTAFSTGMVDECKETVMKAEKWRKTGKDD